MGKLIFITGSTRSGKSRLAVDMATAISRDKVVFAATCIAQDDEMKGRVIKHRQARPSSWRTIEIADDMAREIRGLSPEPDVVLVDCLTLFVSNLLMRSESEAEIMRKVTDALEFISKARYSGIVVSNEVGGGIVPENKMARDFRDLAGTANQIAARYADEVYLSVAGIPVKIK